MEEKFDCIVVGGGIAGLSAAMTLARSNCKFLLVERGEFCGSKNVSGGILWGTDLNRLVPEYWTDESAGFERYVRHRRLSFMDDQSVMSIDFKSAHYDQHPYTGVAVLRARFDDWLSTKVQEAIDESDFAEESFLATNILVEEVVKEDGKVVGIRTGEEVFHADCVILAEGINNLLTRQVGLQDEYVPADHVAVGVKEVITMDQQVLEDRFQLSGLGGVTNEFVGFASQGVEGGGFLYTNRDSISLGLVLGMKDLRDSGKKPYDILNDFRAHPVIADMVRGGEVGEYSAHVVSTGDMGSMPKELYADGVLIAGEAAHLLLNAGKAIQGMDYAMRSGIIAAEAVAGAKDAGDYSAASLKRYRDNLEKSFVMKDLRGFQDAVKLLHDPAMFAKVPNLLCEFGRDFFTIDGSPTEKASVQMRRAIKKHASYWDIIKLGMKGSRAL